MRLFLTIFLLNSVICAGQEGLNGRHMKGNGFEGYVFPSENIKDSTWMPFYDLDYRYTLTNEDVIKAERILKQQIKEINKQTLANQGRKCPIIHKNLKRYIRQYFGYVNKSGEKIVWINLIWNDKDIVGDSMEEKVRIILDGCSKFWNIKVNLSDEGLFDLFINGSA